MFILGTCKLKMPWHPFTAVSLGVYSYLAGCLLWCCQLHVEKTFHFPYPVWNAGGGYTATVVGEGLGEVPRGAADSGVPTAAGTLIFITALGLDNGQRPMRRAGKAWDGAAHFPVAGWQEKGGNSLKLMDFQSAASEQGSPLAAKALISTSNWYKSA